MVRKRIQCLGPRSTEIREQHWSPYPRHQGLGKRSLRDVTPETTADLTSNALALSSAGDTLYVANAGASAIDVIRLGGPAGASTRSQDASPRGGTRQVSR